MNNPYNVLGVKPDASDEDIRSAYRQLVKKYHPDNYADSPLRDTADQKMSEINAAFDSIMNERHKNGIDPRYAARTRDSGNSSGSSGSFGDIRVLIQQNRLIEAEELLDGIPENEKNAEWHFLKGSVFFSRGWLEDAQSHFETACRMDPGNAEYRAALNHMNWKRSGNIGGYGNGQYRQPNTQFFGGCSPCDVCTGLMCTDCCCESMGGDFIPCC